MSVPYANPQSLVTTDWLDANLQGIVERLVRREVERIARRAELS